MLFEGGETCLLISSEPCEVVGGGRRSKQGVTSHTHQNRVCDDYSHTYTLRRGEIKRPTWFSFFHRLRRGESSAAQVSQSNFPSTSPLLVTTFSCEMTRELMVRWLERLMFAGRPKKEGRSVSGRADNRLVVLCEHERERECVCVRVCVCVCGVCSFTDSNQQNHSLSLKYGS